MLETTGSSKAQIKPAQVEDVLILSPWLIFS